MSTTTNTKNLNTRIRLKYDSWTNWQNSTIDLLPGELAIAYLGDTKTPDTYKEGTEAQKATHPVLFKVGPGKFKDLPWASALAADVYSWAKASDVVLDKDSKTIRFVGAKDTDGSDKVITFNYMTEADVTAITGPISKTASDAASAIAAHTTATNPHGIDAATIGLGKVANMSVAEIKADFTGDVADGNDNFVTGDAVYDAIETAKSAAATTAQSKVDALANDKVKTNTENIAKNAADISAMDTAYKDAVKAEEDARKAEDAKLTASITKIEAFFNARGEEEGYDGLNKALDTLVEIQDYLNGTGSATGGILDRVAANEEAIEGLEAIVNTTNGTLTNRVATNEANITAVVGRADTLETIVDGYGATDDTYETVKAHVDAVSVRAEQGITDADAAAKAASAAQSAADKAQREVDALETVVTGVKSTADQAASGVAAIQADYLKSTDELILCCGGSGVVTEG